jgi:hypothetical protein
MLFNYNNYNNCSLQFEKKNDSVNKNNNVDNDFNTNKNDSVNKKNNVDNEFNIKFNNVIKELQDNR